MKVAELAETLAKRNESRFIAKLEDFQLPDDCSSLTIKGGEGTPDRRYLMDEKATAVLAKFFKIPVAYLNECPPDFRAHTIKYWRDRKPQVDVMVEAVEDGLVGIYNPGLMMIPVRRVAEMVENVFEADDDIPTLIRDEKRLHVDVVSKAYQVEIPNPNRIPGRPEVGDISGGGVRFLAYPDKVAAPSASRFFHRYVCTNGMCVPEVEGRINIKGLSVAEVIASMEEAAERLLSDMDDHLKRYADTAALTVPGHPVSFAEQLGTEMDIPAKQLHRVLELVRQLPEDQATVYDINQAFTSVANQVRAYDARTRLQTLGGALALDAQRMIERCDKCEHLLVGS